MSKPSRTGGLLLGMVALAILIGAAAGLHLRQQQSESPQGRDVLVAPSVEEGYLRAVYDPLHFQPAIATARDEQCLACHREIIEDKVRERSPAGVSATVSKAWYQQLSTYEGEQETFHRRHLVTPLARELMNLSCNTCHEGHDPREEAPGSSATAESQNTRNFTLRKQVNVETTCLKCHGQMPTQIMGLPGPWPEHKASFGDSCLTCHAGIRTHRHQVTYLKADAIEAAGAKNADVCYGCHGGRAWYRIAYPYARHPWPDMPADIPDWAQSRPNASEARFLPHPSVTKPAK